MKLNIALRNNTKARLMSDLAEVYSNSNITVIADYGKVVVVNVTNKDNPERVYPLEGLCELQSWYGYEVRL